MRIYYFMCCWFFLSFSEICPPGGTQYYEMGHAPPKRSLFLSPVSPNDQLIYVLSPLDPYLLSLRDPQFLFCHPKTPTSDFNTQKTIILIIWPKLSHNKPDNNWNQDFKEFIPCGQLDVSYSINLALKLNLSAWFHYCHRKKTSFVILLQKDLRFTYTLTERLHNLWFVTERRPILWLLLSPKDPMSEVLVGTCTSLWYMSAPPGICPLFCPRKTLLYTSPWNRRNFMISWMASYISFILLLVSCHYFL